MTLKHPTKEVTLFNFGLSDVFGAIVGVYVMIAIGAGLTWPLWIWLILR